MKTLYITDLDGTLLRPDATLSDYSARTLTELIEKGMAITVSTARSVVDAAFVLDRVPFRIPVVNQNGTFLSDAATGKVLHYLPIARQTAEKTLAILEKHRCDPLIYTYRDGFVDVEYRRPASPAHVDFIKKREKNYHRLVRTETPDLSGEIVFFGVLAGKKESAAAVAELSGLSGITVTHYPDTYYDGYWFIEIAAEGTDKAAAVRRLRAWGGYDRVVAFGDNFNDLAMFAEADTAIAVGNAREEVKAKADLVIGSNREDAVAKYLRDEYEKHYPNG